MIARFGASPLLISLAVFFVLHVFFVLTKVRKLSTFMERALLVNAVAVMAWRIYCFLIGYGQGLGPDSGIVVGAVVVVYVAAIRMLRLEKMGLMVWISFMLTGLCALAFFATHEEGSESLPAFLRSSDGMTTRELERQKEDNIDYRRFVVLEEIKGGYYEDMIHGHSVFAECEMRNLGAKDIGTLTLNATLLSRDGSVLLSEDFYPVSKNDPLQASRKKRFLARFDSTPEGWDGQSIDIRITGLRIAGYYMLSTAKFALDDKEAQEQ